MNEDKELLKNLYKIQSPSGKESGIRAFIKYYILKNMDTEVDIVTDSIGNLLITKGKLDKDEYYPCIVAHMDTVHDIASVRIEERLETIKPRTTKAFAKYYNKYNKNTIISEKKDKPEVNTKKLVIRAINKHTGIYKGGCGDDKNGIWMAIKLLQDFDKIKVIFTVQEEVGCIGAIAINEDFLKDIGYLIEGDRKGKGDIINESYVSPMTSEEFDKAIKKISEDYGYKEADGSFTDICELYAIAGVSAINISVGYYEAHTALEYTIWEELYNAYMYSKELLLSLGNKKFPVEVVKAYPVRNYEGFKNYHNSMWEEDYADSFYKDKTKTTNYNEVMCYAHMDELSNDLIDLDCETCNPISKIKTSMTCSCGEILSKREYSYYCTTCGTHKINLYDF